MKPTPAAPRQARAAISRWVHQWNLDELSDGLLLILSELVTNAVVHARTPIEITLSADRQAVRLAVGDRDQRHPRRARRHHPSGAAPNSPLPAERGRGLVITERLADEWGVDSLPAGKVVWAKLATPASWRHQQYARA